ncbi:hypothetical protein CALCODRAFT_495340 [Calocera cornea HHB12733]|uniref:Extracellular membrane protein CFEM domain-containing protein n=1 Tax=Calocera cornea HHB12733 TaxID=1353952 RepID=A0A165GHJ2_9BASI|nr:hypothetical protein CALCODRAFT_495340 [Calocera cornea HHB12733]
MRVSLVPPLTIVLVTGALTMPVPSLPRGEISNALLSRQSSGSSQTACATGCTSTQDEQLLQQIAACNIPDWNCFCNAWNQLGQDSTCASCLALIDQTGQIAQECGPGGVAGTSTASAADSTATSAGGQCGASCFSAGDQAALGSLTTVDCMEDATCICTALGSMSPACESCVIATQGLTFAQAQSVCSYYVTTTASIWAPSGLGGGSSHSSSAAPTSTSPVPYDYYSGALPSINLKHALVILGGMVAGGMLLL